MKLLLINGSPHEKGSTYRSLSEAKQVLESEGAECEIVWLSNKPINDCIGCGACRKLESRCAFGGDIVNELIEKAKAADGFIFGTPVYYAHPSGRILSVLDRVFYAGSKVFRHKPAAVISVARRAGTTAALDVLSKYITIAQMPLVSSSYWCMTHGAKAEDVELDLEGLQTVRNMARNMAWICSLIEKGKECGITPPENEYTNRTNFIR